MKFEERTKMSKSGKAIRLAPLASENAQMVLDTMVQIASTSPYILRTAEDFAKMSIEEEIKWIENANDNPRGFRIGAFDGEKLIGLLDFGAYKNPKMSHRGSIGVSLHHDYRGDGIGTIMFEALFEIVKLIPDIVTLELTVMGDNIFARKLYTKMGFVEIGINPNAFKLGDSLFCDDIKMIKNLI